MRSFLLEKTEQITNKKGKTLVDRKNFLKNHWIKMCTHFYIEKTRARILQRGRDL